MKCPFCQNPDDKVVDSRETADRGAIRRRRECLGCARRFTTYERIEVAMPAVVKKDGRREPWERSKVSAGLHTACQKRPVSEDAIEESVNRVERIVQDTGQREVECAIVGEAVMECLKGLDDVAYVRFASVYKSFRDIDEFVSALDTLIKEKGAGR